MVLLCCYHGKNTVLQKDFEIKQVNFENLILVFIFFLWNAHLVCLSLF